MATLQACSYNNADPVASGATVVVQTQADTSDALDSGSSGLALPVPPSLSANFVSYDMSTNVRPA